MQVSFGKGLIKIGDTLYNIDNIEAMKTKAGSKDEKAGAEIRTVSGKSDFYEGSYEFGELQKAFLNAQHVGFASVEQKSDSVF